MRTWDDDFYESQDFQDKVVRGLCVNCPLSYSDETSYIPETKATHRYMNQQGMCEKHYNEIVETVRIIVASCKPAK